MREFLMAIVIFGTLFGAACKNNVKAPAPAVAGNVPPGASAPAPAMTGAAPDVAAPAMAETPKAQSPSFEKKAKRATKVALNTTKATKIANKTETKIENDDLGEGRAPGIKLKQSPPSYE